MRTVAVARPSKLTSVGRLADVGAGRARSVADLSRGPARAAGFRPRPRTVAARRRASAGAHVRPMAPSALIVIERFSVMLVGLVGQRLRPSPSEISGARSRSTRRRPTMRVLTGRRAGVPSWSMTRSSGCRSWPGLAGDDGEAEAVGAGLSRLDRAGARRALELPARARLDRVVRRGSGRPEATSSSPERWAQDDGVLADGERPRDRGLLVDRRRPDRTTVVVHRAVPGVDLDRRVARTGRRGGGPRASRSASPTARRRPGRRARRCGRPGPQCTALSTAQAAGQHAATITERDR